MSFITIPEGAQRGDEVTLQGYKGRHTLVARNASTVVLKRDGYAENPGSRYSGLRAYYPAEMLVYAVQAQHDPLTVRADLTIAYPVRPTKETDHA